MDIKKYYQRDRYQKEMLEWRNKHYYSDRLQLITSVFNIKFQGKILDAGCGDGGLAKEIKQLYPATHIFGTDISKLGCRLAAQWCDQTKIANLNEKIPFKRNFFNYIIAQEVIEHLIDPDKFLEECYRVLKPGGTVILTTPNMLAWHQRIFCLIGIPPTFIELSSRDRRVGLGLLKYIIKNKQPVGHIHVYTSLGLRDIVQLYGFKKVYLRGAPIHYPYFGFLQVIYNSVEKLFSRIPSLSSNLLLIAQKP